MADDIARAARVDVVPAEVYARIVIALLVRERVPQLAAVHVEQHLVPEEGAADAERDHHVRVPAGVFTELLEPCDRRRRVDMSVRDVGRLREQHLLRFAVLREMSADKARRPHDLHRLVRVLQILRIECKVGIRHLALAVEIVIVECKSGFQYKTHHCLLPALRPESPQAARRSFPSAAPYPAASRRSGE